MKRPAAVMAYTPLARVNWLKQLIEAPEQAPNTARRDVPQGRQVAEESVNL